jgi:hypothetical protein
MDTDNSCIPALRPCQDKDSGDAGKHGSSNGNPLRLLISSQHESPKG